MPRIKITFTKNRIKDAVMPFKEGDVVYLDEIVDSDKMYAFSVNEANTSEEETRENLDLLRRMTGISDWKNSIKHSEDRYINANKFNALFDLGHNVLNEKERIRTTNLYIVLNNRNSSIRHKDGPNTGVGYFEIVED